ncbi:type IV pilus assembly protein PilZ [Bacteriovorax sp. Seq25_V]|nr:type IV pilus assembly protein PilZ [Bacteriovorax sp. Seq25_V]
MFINSFVYAPEDRAWVPLLSHPEIPHEIKVAATFCEAEIPVPLFHPVPFNEVTLQRDIEEEKVIEVDNSHLEQFEDIKKEISDLSSRVISKEDEVIARVNTLRDMITTLSRDDKQRIELEERLEKSNLRIQNITIENDLLKNNLKKAMTKIEILQNRINENNQTNSSVAKIYSDKDLGLEDLRNGKTFEFLNSKVWFIKSESGNKGPLRFDELLHMKESGELKDSKIKRSGDLQWKDMQDILELSAEVSLHYEDKANSEKSIYLVQRGEYRADIREAITFMIRDNEYKGYLTNISLSGGFIELVKLDGVDHTKDRSGTLFFNEGLVSESISCDFKIKRVADGRPKGIGFAFINVSQKNTEILGKLISKIINANNKIAA